MATTRERNRPGFQVGTGSFQRLVIPRIRDAMTRFSLTSSGGKCFTARASIAGSRNSLMKNRISTAERRCPAFFWASAHTAYSNTRVARSWSPSGWHGRAAVQSVSHIDNAVLVAERSGFVPEHLAGLGAPTAILEDHGKGRPCKGTHGRTPMASRDTESGRAYMPPASPAAPGSRCLISDLRLGRGHDIHDVAEAVDSPVPQRPRIV